MTQKDLPGKGFGSNIPKTVKEQANILRTIRMKRMALAEKEDEAAATLLDRMKKKKCKDFTIEMDNGDRVRFYVDSKEKVKTSKVSSPQDD